MKVRIEFTEEFDERELLAIGLKLGHMRPARRIDVSNELETVVADAISQYRETIGQDVQRLLGFDVVYDGGSNGAG